MSDVIDLSSESTRAGFVATNHKFCDLGAMLKSHIDLGRRGREVMPTPKQIEVLEYAMWQLLSDMGSEGNSVSLASKALARVAYEPFKQNESTYYHDWMTLEQAQKILKECDG